MLLCNIYHQSCSLTASHVVESCNMSMNSYITDIVHWPSIQNTSGSIPNITTVIKWKNLSGKNNQLPEDRSTANFEMVHISNMLQTAENIKHNTYDKHCFTRDKTVLCIKLCIYQPQQETSPMSRKKSEKGHFTSVESQLFHASSCFTSTPLKQENFGLYVLSKNVFYRQESMG